MKGIMINKGKNLASRYDLFVFDWDGTLSSLKPLRALNERINPYWKYKKLHSMKTSEVDNNAVMERKSREVKFLAPFFDVIVRFIRPKLHNDSKEVLQELKKKHKKIVLLTNGASYRVKRELSYLKLTNYFDIVMSTQDLNALKPNPLGLNLILTKTKIKKEKVLYIGDMVDDVKMARLAKVQSCAMACGFDSEGKLKAAKPDYLFTSMEEFKKAL
jgi:HAD superfamily hydrolase (TIGR01549 family)